MAATGAGAVASGFSPVLRCHTSLTTGSSKAKLVVSATSTTWRSAMRVEQPANRTSEKGGFDKGSEVERMTEPRGFMETEPDVEPLSSKDYFEGSKELMRSDGGPPRWFSPSECRSRLKNSPLMLYLPGIDGVGLGLILQHKRLGEMFDIWCLHIPTSDRTTFTDLVKLVERTVRAEYCRHSPKSPIYLVGESLGGCLALAIAARNPDIDLILILANPATCFGKSQLQPLLPLLDFMPEQLLFTVPYALSLTTGIPSRMVTATLEKGFPLQQTVGEVSQSVTALISYLSVMAEALPTETLLWKLKMLKSASTYANSRLHAVKAQTLLLCSGKDQLLPSQEEGVRLRHLLPKCEIRKFDESGHALFLEDDIDLVTIIKGASFYRRSRHIDYVSDYLPPTPSEFKKLCESISWMEVATSPVLLSTLENGKIVRGLAGIPLEGPVLFVGYHMLLGLELAPLVARFWSERNILLRGIAHPMAFTKLRQGRLPDLSAYDAFRLMGAVPVSPTNLYRLLSNKSHILLYPGGMREALHRKGEEYKLFWPEQSEFIRMAARFGAKIVPFGAVGEDDIGQLVIDYDDQIKIPQLKAFINEITEEAVQLRSDSKGEVTNQDVHLPVIMPKIPGRFYYLFGKPIETEGRKEELRRRGERADELYVEVKREVERCIQYLKEKREEDPYRNILPRLLYMATHGGVGSSSVPQVPTFEVEP